MFQDGPIEGVVVRALQRFTDERGWLCELFRQDELEQSFYPVMGYLSETEPGMARGPHEHEEQADLFCFLGPSTFRLYCWDNRESSPTYRYRMTIEVGETNPQSVIIPPGVVHAYKNIGEARGIVINCPNRLYAGEGKSKDVDEIRHEDDPDSPFTID